MKLAISCRKIKTRTSKRLKGENREEGGQREGGRGAEREEGGKQRERGRETERRRKGDREREEGRQREGGRGTEREKRGERGEISLSHVSARNISCSGTTVKQLIGLDVNFFNVISSLASYDLSKSTKGGNTQ